MATMPPPTDTDTYGDLVKDGVIDPAKVTRIALQNTSSIAGLMLTRLPVLMPAAWAEGCTNPTSATEVNVSATG